MAWDGLEVRHLLALLAVADEGAFSRAATRLGYTQSAVSQQVAALERLVGTTLFDRPGGPRPVQLTEAGAALADHARTVLDQVRSAEADLRALGSGERGTLRVGSIQSVGTRVLPELLRRFRGQRPHVEVQLREAHDPAELLELVAQGGLDVTFAHEPLPDGPFAVRIILDDPFVLLAPAGSPEADLASVTPSHVSTLPLIGYRNASCQTMLVDRLDGAAADLAFVFHSDDNPTIQGMVAAGFAFCLAPLLTVDPDDAGTAIVPLDPPLEPRRIALAWHADRRPSPAVPVFVDTAAEVCADLQSRSDLARPAPVA